MSKRRPYVRLLIALAYTSAMLFKTPAYAQLAESLPAKPDNTDPRVKASNPGNTIVAEARRPGDLENEVAALKAENVAVREQLRRLEEQQKTLLELVEELRRTPDAFPISDEARAVTATNQVLPADS